MDNWFDTLAPPFVALAAVLAGLAILYALRHRVASVVHELRISKIGAAGFSIEFIEEQTAEAYRKQGLGPPSADERRRLRDLAEHLAPLAAGSRILWVDDVPSGNGLERGTFREWRIEVQTRRSTEEAMVELRDQTEGYDLVISDWIRPGPDGGKAEEGMRLLTMAREEEPELRFVFYHGELDEPVQEDRRVRAQAAGAVGATANPGKLYRMVLLALVQRRLDGNGAS